MKDSKGAVIPGATVEVTAGTLGNALSSLSATTDANGAATFSYTPTNAGTDTLIFSALGATATATLAVSGQDFVFTSPASGTSVTVGASTSISVRYRLNGVAVSGATVNFAATGGTFSSSTGVTNGSGVATTSLTSTFAGPTTVTATISGVGTISLPISFVATTPANIVLQVSPSAIAPNANGSVAQQATVSARVTDANGNPVKGVTVDFSRTADPSIGNLSAPSATTDANGEASVKYISGPNSTATDGVRISGTVSGTSVVGNTQLTVNQQALFIALGTSNTISNLTVNGVVDETTYVKPWTVYVTDANGVAVSGKTLTIRILSVAYGKGRLAYSTTDGVWEASDYTGAIDVNTVMPAGNMLWCTSEDANNNGTLDSGEDTNGSGSLEPGNVISLAPGNSTVVTDVNGRATINLLYAESYAPWVQVTLRATATVAGTESKKDATFVVSGMSTDFSKADTPPAGVVSPFGRRASCASPY
ncbi:MAG: Ig-like domain-containing protein [Aquabacterium sp.]|nr:Ig-like domain-containing protein [Aquabacterium sp.]